MKSYIGFFALAVLALSPSIGRAEQPKQGWERKFIAEFYSAPSESLPDFLIRVGAQLHHFTRSSNVEACGAIGESAGRYAVKLFTDGVPQGCAILASEIPDGYAYSGETIHSHPWKKILTMTPEARAWSSFYKDGNGGAPTLRNDGAVGFSKSDRRVGGWLVAGGRLLHLENGKSVSYGSVMGGENE